MTVLGTLIVRITVLLRGIALAEMVVQVTGISLLRPSQEPPSGQGRHEMPVLGLFVMGKMISRPYAGRRDPNSGVTAPGGVNPGRLHAARQGRSALLNCGG
jgi:hypothetical protein